MAEVGKDLVICDEEYLEYQAQINKIGDAIENKLSGLIAQLQMVCDYGIQEGSVHDNLQLFVDSLNSMSGQLTFFTNRMGECAKSFVRDTNALDILQSIGENGKFNNIN